MIEKVYVIYSEFKLNNNTLNKELVGIYRKEKTALAAARIAQNSINNVYAEEFKVIAELLR